MSNVFCFCPNVQIERNHYAAIKGLSEDETGLQWVVVALVSFEKRLPRLVGKKSGNSREFMIIWALEGCTSSFYSYDTMRKQAL
ncbi:hypothetical protein [Bacillus smithii]|uniref:hypothetical protein n=1 Tax=Bacillus smithii TaxID=1479 RepID=UPI0030C9623B